MPGLTTFDWRRILGTFGNKPESTHKKKDRNGGPGVFDQAFKRMAVELSHAKGSVQEAARELGIDSIAPANRSDRGVQYASTEFRGHLKGSPVVQSMSRKGNCWDNAVAESFRFGDPIQNIQKRIG